MLLAIESSCDETALSLVDSNNFHLVDELLASQIEFHKEYGGVVPELAAREHIKNLPLLLEELLSRNSISIKQLTAVSVTNGPGLKGCLLVGVSFAKGLCQALGIPLIPVHHIEGHLFAGHISAEKAITADSSELKFPYLSLVVSGGHSILVTVDGLTKYTLLAKTRDDAAGEAFDKIATLLGLPYPGGPALSKLAETGERGRFKLPVALAGDISAFSFSGLKTAVAKIIRENEFLLKNDSQLRADIAASAESAIVKALVEKSVAQAIATKAKRFLLTGGVAANTHLRESLKSALEKRGVEFFVPERKWCTDNATMIAAIAATQLSEQAEEYTSWSSSGLSSSSLGPNAPFELGVAARLELGALARGESS